jgi:signal transduction histidine kinase
MLAVVGLSVAIVLFFLYVAHTDELEARDRIQFVHLAAVSEAQQLAREARSLRDLVEASLDPTLSSQSGPAGIKSVQLDYRGVLQSMRSRLLLLSNLQQHSGDVLFSSAVTRLMERFDGIDRTLRHSQFDADIIASIDVLSLTIAQYDRLHAIAADEELHALADRESRRPASLAFLAAGLVVSGLAALFLIRSLGSSLRRRREAELALLESQEKLNHIQKLDALGRLVGGVAHDFNNWLTVILGHAGLLLDNTKGDERLELGLNEIKQASLQAASLTKQLLAFSRRQKFEPRVLDLNELIQDQEPMLRRIIGADIRLSFNYSEGLFDVELDPDQLQQVILNLLNNSRDAMPEGGALSVSTENVTVSQEDAEAVEVPEGKYVKLTVSDTGTGMDKDTIRRAFEPFFTTKEKGHGTGLGLSTVHGIVTASNGIILVESSPGAGSSFAIYLPRVEPREVTAPVKPEATRSERGSATVLVVDDNDQVRLFVEEGLGTLGYRVLTANGGAGGLRLCQTEPGAIDVILSDVVMPETSGPKFMAKALKLRPAAVAIYMSAYTKDEILEFRRNNTEADIPLIEKPFELATLSRLIRKQLDKAAGK